MANDGKTPGDGSSNPFGNGKGGSGGTMAGNDFVKNPMGGSPGTRGNDFLTNPAGAGPTGAKPQDFAKGGKGAQKSGSAPDLNGPSEIREGGGLIPLADVPGNSPRKQFIGTGSIGDSKKPFRGI